MEIPSCDNCGTEVGNPDSNVNPKHMGIHGDDGIYCSQKCLEEAEQ